MDARTSRRFAVSFPDAARFPLAQPVLVQLNYHDTALDDFTALRMWLVEHPTSTTARGSSPDCGGKMKVDVTVNSYSCQLSV
jgi:hypothetical protein